MFHQLIKQTVADQERSRKFYADAFKPTPAEISKEG
jgi:hypothetical protein